MRFTCLLKFQSASGTHHPYLRPTDLGLRVGPCFEERARNFFEARRLRQLDAVFSTTAAPARALQQLAADPGLRLLPVKGDAMGRLLQARPGLTPLTLPPNTYPRQQQPIVTVASAALLLTTLDTPLIEVERVADLVFSRMPQQHAGSADVVKVSAENELRGVTIPLHPVSAPGPAVTDSPVYVTSLTPEMTVTPEVL